MKEEANAVRRAIERAEALNDADLAECITRIERQEPKLGLVGMAAVEKIANEVSLPARKWLLHSLKEMEDLRIAEAEKAKKAGAKPAEGAKP